MLGLFFNRKMGKCFQQFRSSLKKKSASFDLSTKLIVKGSILAVRSQKNNSDLRIGVRVFRTGQAL